MNLPVSSARFVGRDAELADIARLLSNPACRLLTLVGPGGIGKTRLAIEAVQRFPDRLCFVPLQPLTSSDFLVSAIADALDFQFYSGDEPEQQLLDFLRDKSWLLVLDNFEHLLDGATLLSEMLAHAPEIRLLVTSRERLNLVEEWVLEVGGLVFPASESDADPERYSAVELFVQHARRVKSSFRLTEAECSAVIRICHLVGGMPLGIELAATWARALSCDAIADEIERSLDILETPARNVEPRHRTMRAAFEPTWKRLSDEEREAFMRLAVFRGGFTREAAEAVAGAPLRTLTALVDKSLVRVDASGRYDLHELLRQYAADKLSDVGEAQTTTQRHLAYFLKLAEQAEAHIYGREQLAWFDQLEIELDNLRAALTRSVQNRLNEAGLRLAGTLGWFFQYRAHWHEGLTWLKHLLAMAPDAALSTRAKALHSAGELSGVFDNPENTKQFCLKALTLAQQVNDQQTIAWSLSTLGFFTWDRESLNESVTMFRNLDDPYGLSHALRRLACRDIEQGDYSHACSLLDEALVSAREAGDRNATAWALLLLGVAAWRQNRDARQTAALLEESLSAFYEIRNVAEACAPMIMLARVEQVMGNTMRSQALYSRTLNLLQELRLNTYGIKMLCILLAGVGSLARVQGKLERAARLLGAAEEGIPGFFGFFPRAEFDHLASAVRAQFGESAFAAAWAEGKVMTREQVVAYALQCCWQPVELMQASPVLTSPLAEPLSARELEVLRLIAEGLSNGEIAERLALAKSTIKWYINEIFSKLDATSRTEAVDHARILGLLG